MKYLIAAILVLSFRAQAGEKENLDRLEEAKNQVAFDYAKLNELNSSHGLYRKIRDQYILGSSGLRISMNVLHQQSLDWIANWAQINQYIDSVQNLPAEQLIGFASTLEAKIKGQSHTCQKIKGDILLSIAKFERMKLELNQIDTLSPKIFPENYQQVISRFNARVTDINRFAEESLQKLNYQQDYFDIALRDFRQALMDKLRESLIKGGSKILIDSIEVGLTALKADELIHQRELEIRKLYEDFFQYYRFRLVYAAENSFGILTDKANQALKTIEDSNLDESWTKQGKDQILRWQEQAQLNLNALERYPVTRLTQMAQGRLVRHFNNKCRDQDPFVKCTALSTLEKISDEQIADMNENQLRDLQSFWLKIGPLTGS